MYQKCLNFNEKLDQFKGRSVQLCYNHCNISSVLTFVYELFDYETNNDTNEICFMNSLHYDCKIYIRLNDIIEFKDLGMNNNGKDNFQFEVIKPNCKRLYIRYLFG